MRRRALADAMHFPAEDPAGYSLFYMYFPVFRIPEFLFGAVVGVLFVRCRPMTQLGRRICLALGCVGFIAGFYFLRSPCSRALVQQWRPRALPGDGADRPGAFALAHLEPSLFCPPRRRKLLCQGSYRSKAAGKFIFFAEVVYTELLLKTLFV